MNHARLQTAADPAAALDPCNPQGHIFDKTQPEHLAVPRRLRGAIDESPAIVPVGEAQRGMQVQRHDTGGDDLLRMSCDFDFLSGVYSSGSRVKEIPEKLDRNVTDGWACRATGGDLHVLEATDDRHLIMRTHGSTSMIGAFNLTCHDQPVQLPKGCGAGTGARLSGKFGLMKTFCRHLGRHSTYSIDDAAWHD